MKRIIAFFFAMLFAFSFMTVPASATEATTTPSDDISINIEVDGELVDKLSATLKDIIEFCINIVEQIVDKAKEILASWSGDLPEISVETPTDAVATVSIA